MHIHAECLKEWLSSRRTVKQYGQSISYTWKSLDCELCRTTFPSHIYCPAQKRKISVTEIIKPPGSYLTLESLNQNTSKQIHAISLNATQSIRIGRGHDCDVRVTDISVSRQHALLRRGAKNDFYLEDLDSKFGTLVQMKHPIQLTDEPLTLQSGRTTIWM